MIGIYKIENKINGKVYIGQSVNIGGRWNSHLYDLERGTHPNPELQHEYNEFGFRNFTFEILEKCEKEELLERESYYIELNKDNSYNVYGNEHKAPRNRFIGISKHITPMLSKMSVVSQNIILISYIKYSLDKSRSIEIYSEEYVAYTDSPSQSFYSITSKGMLDEIVNCGIYKGVEYKEGILYLEFNDIFMDENNFAFIEKYEDILSKRRQKYFIPLLLMCKQSKGENIRISDLKNILNLPESYNRMDCVTSKILKPHINLCDDIGIKFEYKIIRQNRKSEYIKLLCS